MTLAAGVIVFTPGTLILTCTPLSGEILGYGAGNRRYANRWLDRLQGFSDPESAQTAYPEVQFKRFENGEWVMGVSDDSHRSRWGGTIVVKDSTGAKHVWFGHVCGPRRLEIRTLRESKSLKSFYAHDEWKQFEFREVELSR
jgi:hypothetical protein